MGHPQDSLAPTTAARPARDAIVPLAIAVFAMATAVGCTGGADGGTEGATEAGSGGAEGTDASTGGPTPTDDSTGSAMSSSASASTGDGESGASDATGEAACASFHSGAVEGPEVTIRLSHTGSERVFFEPEGCLGLLPFRVYDDSSDQEIVWRGADCLETCDRHLDEGECSFGCNGCAPPDFGWIEPATQSDAVWTGLAITLLDWTDACTPAPTCDIPCSVEDQAPAGTYRVELTVFRTCHGECACENRRSDPVCSVVDADALADPILLSGLIEYPGQTAVELVLGD